MLQNIVIAKKYYYRKNIISIVDNKVYNLGFSPRPFFSYWRFKETRKRSMSSLVYNPDSWWSRKLSDLSRVIKDWIEEERSWKQKHGNLVRKRRIIDNYTLNGVKKFCGMNCISLFWTESIRLRNVGGAAFAYVGTLFEITPYLRDIENIQNREGKTFPSLKKES